MREQYASLHTYEAFSQPAHIEDGMDPMIMPEISLPQ